MSESTPSKTWALHLFEKDTDTSHKRLALTRLYSSMAAQTSYSVAMKQLSVRQRRRYGNPFSPQHREWKHRVCD